LLDLVFLWELGAELKGPPKSQTHPSLQINQDKLQKQQEGRDEGG